MPAAPPATRAIPTADSCDPALRNDDRSHTTATVAMTPMSGPSPVAFENAIPLLKPSAKRRVHTTSTVCPSDRVLTAQCFVTWSSTTMAVASGNSDRRDMGVMIA